MNTIRTAASSFRQAIITTRGARLIGLRDFPAGACRDSSLLLGEYFFECGFGEWSYVAGFKQGAVQSHAWIERDGLLVDITADQFDEINESVWLTRDRSWHQQFLYAPEGERAARLDAWDARTQRSLEEAYTKILTALRAS